MTLKTELKIMNTFLKQFKMKVVYKKDKEQPFFEIRYLHGFVYLGSIFKEIEKDIWHWSRKVCVYAGSYWQPPEFEDVENIEEFKNCFDTLLAFIFTMLKNDFQNIEESIIMEEQGL